MLNLFGLGKLCHITKYCPTFKKTYNLKVSLQSREQKFNFCFISTYCVQRDGEKSSESTVLRNRLLVCLGRSSSVTVCLSSFTL